MLRVTRRAPVGSSSRFRAFARLNLLPSASCRAGMREVASDTQGAAAWRFFLSPEQSFRSQRHGVGSGLVALLHVDLEKCACVLFHSSIVHGRDGNHPYALLPQPSGFHTQGGFGKPLIFLFSPYGPERFQRIPFPALLAMFHQGTRFPSDISFNFVRSIECNSGRLVFH